MKYGGWIAIALGALLLVNAGCAERQGSKGNSGAAGAPGAAGTPSASVIQETLTFQVSSVTVPADGKPVVTFKLLDQDGLAYSKLKLGSNLKSADLRVTIAKLVPATAAQPSYWENYLNASKTKDSSKPGVWVSPPVASRTAIQPTQEGSSDFAAGTLTYDSSTQAYTYTFAQSISAITAPVTVAYDASATHRVGMELRNVNTTAGDPLGADAWYDFVPAGGTPAPRAIVSTDTCNNACHGKLAAHGEGRFSVEYCVMCHNARNADPNGGDVYDMTAANPLDLRIMVHRLHLGENLPSQVDGTLKYQIWGFNDALTDFGNGTLPVMSTSRSTSTTAATCLTANGTCATKTTDQLNLHTTAFAGGTFFPDCVKCHVEGAGAPAQAANWKDNPSQQACTSCHNNIYFGASAPASGLTLNSYDTKWVAHSGGTQADNSACAGCHGSTGTKPADVAHNYAVQIRAQADLWNFTFDAGTAPTYDTATRALFVTFYVDKSDAVTPGNSVSKVNFRNTTANPEFAGSPMPGSLNLKVAWPADEYANDQQVGATAPSQALSLNLATATLSAGAPAGATGVQSSCTASTAPPCTYTAKITLPSGWDTAWTVNNKVTVGTFFDGHPGGFVQAGFQTSRWRAVPAQSVIKHFEIDKTPGGVVTAAALDPAVDVDKVRRQIVDTGKCKSCHTTLTFHGTNRSDDVQVCVACHNPNDTDIGQRSLTGAISSTGVVLAPAITNPSPDVTVVEAPIDMKFMIHAIHAGGKQSPDPSNTTLYSGFRSKGLMVYGNGNTPSDFTATNFPNRLSNCQVCHMEGTYELPVTSLANPTTVRTSNGFSAWAASTNKFGVADAPVATPAVITMTGHGYVNTNGPLRLNVASGATVPTGLTKDTLDYYVCSVSGATFQLQSAAGASTCTGTVAAITVAGVVASGNNAATTVFALYPTNRSKDPTDDKNRSPTAAVCSACHDDPVALGHMVTTGNGVIEGIASPVIGSAGITDAQYDAAQLNYGAGFELCELCHGPGAILDVEKVHKVGQ